MNNIPWWGYVLLAGLAWGTYVPIIFFGGSELGGKQNARLMAILCVGIAYFVLAVVFPLALFLSGQQQWPEMKATGLVFAGLAGVAGAIGAICVVFASSSAMAAGLEVKKLNPSFNPASYRLLIGPLIFGLAPVINTLISLDLAPGAEQPVALRRATSRLETGPGHPAGRGRIVPGALFQGRGGRNEESGRAKSATPPPAVATAVPAEKPNPVPGG